MVWLKDNTYFARSGSGSFLLSYDALLRLDETVPTDVVDSLMPAMAGGQSFQEASAQLPADQQAGAGNLLGILADHELTVDIAEARSSKPGQRPESRVSLRSLLLSGDEALAETFAAVLRQCGLDVRVVDSIKTAAAVGSPASLTIEIPTEADGDGSPLCHIAATDAGICWYFADDCPSTTAVPPLAAFRRAASFPSSAGPDRASGTQIASGTLSTIAAHQIAHAITRPGRVRPSGAAVTFLDRRTLRTSTHRVTAHPLNMSARPRSADELRRDLRRLQDSPPLGGDALPELWQRVSDKRFGAFAELDDTNVRQLPLKVVLARMSDPCDLLSEPPAVAGVGINGESARQRAVVQALAAYGSIAVDPRLLVDESGTFLGSRDADPSRLLGSVRDGSVDAFVRVIDLTDGRVRLVAAHDAFPVLRTSDPFRVPCGTSAALDWRHALAHGLMQHYVRLIVAGSSLEAGQPAALAAEDFDQDAEVRYLAAMVKAAGIDLMLHDITGPGGVPVVACASASDETVYGGGADLAEAVREALTAALFRYQLRRDPALKAAIGTASTIWTSPASSAFLSPERLVQVLTSHGYTPSVFVLDHDRAVHEAFPYALRVVV